MLESSLIDGKYMEQIINNSSIFLIFIFGLIFLRVGWKIFDFYKRVTHVKDFADYISVLEYHMNKSYDIIHKDRILVYSLEATRLPDKDFEAITHDFVRLVIKFIGPALHKDFIEFYGNEDTFFFNMVEYFNTRYEEDSIRKQTIDDMSDMDSNITEVQNYEPGPTS